MEQYFLAIDRRIKAKNNQQIALEQEVLKFRNCLIVGEGKREMFIRTLTKKLSAINEQHPRSTNDTLEQWKCGNNRTGFRLGCIDFSLTKVNQQL